LEDYPGLSGWAQKDVGGDSILTERGADGKNKAETAVMRPPDK
jgi:hypothetical protein